MPARALLAAPAIAAVLALTGCGGGDAGEGGIPPETADEMLQLTEEIEAASLPEDCDAAQETTTALRSEAETVETRRTKEALDAMITRLDQNLDEDCETGTSPDPEAEEPTTTTTSVPVEPTTTTTTTEPTEPVPEEDAEEGETPEQPPGEGGGPNGPPQTPPGQGGGGAPSGGIEED